MGCLNDRSRIATFFEKLAHFFRFVRKIRVITAQTSESKKLRIGNGIFNLLNSLAISLVLSKNA